MAEEQTPLHGVTVLDLSGYIAGPYGCTLLGDLGASVIKIEPPEGDNLRNYPSTLDRESRAFLGVNRRKRGIVLDLKHPDGLAVLRRMVERADVLVHNFRPAVPRRLGIDYESLKVINPRLVYCALTGYGETGPLRDRAGYDQVLQSMSGICVEQGKPGDPAIVYGSAVDFYAASMLAFAVASALYERQRTGQGRRVGVSLLRSALAMQSARLVWADGEGRDVARDMRSGGITGLHPTKSGYLYLSANTPHFWQALCERTGLSELAADPRYDTVKKRAASACRARPRVPSRTCSTIPKWRRKASSRASSTRGSAGTGPWRIRSSSAGDPRPPRRRCSASMRTRSWRPWATATRRSSDCVKPERWARRPRSLKPERPGSPDAQQALRARVEARALHEGARGRCRRDLLRPGRRGRGESQGPGARNARSIPERTTGRGPGEDHHRAGERARDAALRGRRRRGEPARRGPGQRAQARVRGRHSRRGGRAGTTRDAARTCPAHRYPCEHRVAARAPACRRDRHRQSAGGRAPARPGRSFRAVGHRPEGRTGGARDAARGAPGGSRSRAVGLRHGVGRGER